MFGHFITLCVKGLSWNLKNNKHTETDQKKYFAYKKKVQLLSYHAEGNMRNKILTNIAPKDYAITDLSLPSIFKVFFESGKCDFYLACNIRKLQADYIKNLSRFAGIKNVPPVFRS